MQNIHSIRKKAFSKDYRRKKRTRETELSRKNRIFSETLTESCEDNLDSNEEDKLNLMICTGGYLKEDSNKYKKLDKPVFELKITSINDIKDFNVLKKRINGTFQLLILFEADPNLQIQFWGNSEEKKFFSNILIMRIAVNLEKKPNLKWKKNQEILPPRLKLHFGENESRYFKYKKYWHHDIIAYCKFKSLDLFSTTDQSFSFQRDIPPRLFSIFENNLIPPSILNNYFTEEEIGFLNISMRKFGQIVKISIELFNENKDEEDLIDTLYRVVNQTKYFLYNDSLQNLSTISPNTTCKYSSLQSRLFSDGVSNPSIFTFNPTDQEKNNLTKRKLSLIGNGEKKKSLSELDCKEFKAETPKSSRSLANTNNKISISAAEFKSISEESQNAIVSYFFFNFFMFFLKFRKTVLKWKLKIWIKKRTIFHLKIESLNTTIYVVLIEIKNTKKV